MLVAEMADKKTKTVGRRLRHLREALGYQHGNAFARHLGIMDARWYNLENGYPLSKEVAFLLVQKVSGLSLDWLYYGRTDGLSKGLDKKLGGFPEGPPTPSRRNTNTS